MEKACALGYEAIEADITEIDYLQKSVRFVVASHFLEHLPSLILAGRCLRSAIKTARDFVFVRQPWFDSDGYLLANQLKLYWSDWQDHLCHMITLDFVKILSRSSGVERFVIYGAHRIRSSEDQAVHSIFSPQDQHGWVQGLHPAKKPTVFEQAVYRETYVIILPEGSSESLKRLESLIGRCDRLFDSDEAQLHRNSLPSLPYRWRPRAALFVSGTVSDHGPSEAGYRLRASGNDPQIMLPAYNFGGSVSLTVEMTAPSATLADLYIFSKGGSGWGDVPPVRVPVRSGRSRVTLTAHHDTPIESLRFDPGQVPGEYLIHDIELFVG